MDGIPPRVPILPGSLPEPDPAPVPSFPESSLKCQTFCTRSRAGAVQAFTQVLHIPHVFSRAGRRDLGQLVGKQGASLWPQVIFEAQPPMGKPLALNNVGNGITAGKPGSNADPF